MNPSMDDGPAAELPWSHLSKKEFQRAKKLYGSVWSNVLHPTGSRIFGQLLFHLSYETGACFPATETIAKKTKDKNGKVIGRELNRKTVSRYIAQFKEMGLIEVVNYREVGPTPSTRTQKGNRTNRYIIDLDKIDRTENGEYRAVASRPTDYFITLGGEVPLPRTHPRYQYFYPAIGPADIPSIRENDLPPILAKEFVSRVEENIDSSAVDVAKVESDIAWTLQNLATPEEMLQSVLYFGAHTSWHVDPIWEVFIDRHADILKSVRKTIAERGEHQE